MRKAVIFYWGLGCWCWCCASATSSHTIVSASSAAPTTSMASLTKSPRFRTWPITAVRALEPALREMGLEVPASRIDGTTNNHHTEKAPLSDALVSVGTAGRGGTGSFVSSEGLVLTNWHVAYDAVRQASLNAGKDYLETGFVARTREDELPAPNYEAWITKSCTDVSREVVAALEGASDPLERAHRCRDKMQELAQAAQAKLPPNGGGFRCDVQEMIPNESYLLCTYERLRDVRIVYVPPRSLGNFGGDVDNFEWPRHTADFALLRAYAGGAPYRPRAFLKTQPNGAREGDFVFLLGFPGRTMRYAPSSRLEYSDQVAVPKLVQDFSRKLQLIAEHERISPEAALKLGTSKKSLANEFKRSKGKLTMMRKLRLIPERKEEERALLEKAPGAKEAYDRLAAIYDELRQQNPVSSALEACRGVYAGSTLLAVGHAFHEYLGVEKDKPDDQREAAYRDRNLPFLCQRLAKRIGDVCVPHETALVRDALQKLADTPGTAALHKKVAAVLEDNRLETIVWGSGFLELRSADALEAKLLGGMDPRGFTFDLEGGGSQGSLSLLASSASLLGGNDHRALDEDPFFVCASLLWKTYEETRDRTSALLSERDALFAGLLDLQRTHHSSGEAVYPDCNGSLRLSAGYVEGYKAADAVEHTPGTTLAGLLDKATEAALEGTTTGQPHPFVCPARLREMLASDESLGKVPVCILYSTDTVGGNSGSPLMNAKGELVGINFDRQKQGLMNEFKWSKEYSRSIGVDVRFMLWLIGDYDGASGLVDELLSS